MCDYPQTDDYYAPDENGRDVQDLVCPVCGAFYLMGVSFCSCAGKDSPDQQNHDPYEVYHNNRAAWRRASGHSIFDLAEKAGRNTIRRVKDIDEW